MGRACLSGDGRYGKFSRGCVDWWGFALSAGNMTAHGASGEKRMYWRGCLILAIAIAGAAYSATARAQSPIGSATSIQNQVQGIIGSGSQTIAAGGSVFQNERVRTGDDGQAQLVFLDQTNLGVGPKSEVTLDRFVYNPDRGTGRVAIDASRGVFRFVTGTQDPKSYQIKTPIATIEVRGTEFHLLVARDHIVVALVHGALRITTVAGRVVWLTEPGTTITIYANGRVTGPSPWTTPFTKYAGSVPFPYFVNGFAALPPFFGGFTAGAAGASSNGWTGCYAGGNVGGGWNRLSGFNPTLNANYGTIDGSGVAGGGQIGCDYGFNSFVVGVEGMLDWSRIKGDGLNPSGAVPITNNGTIPWFATLTGRIGYVAAPSLLVYAKGGGAWIKDNITTNVTATGVPIAISSFTGSGWTVGGGLEYMFAPHWSVFVEYNYMSFARTATFSFVVPPGTPFPINLTENVQTALVGVNFRY